jgi:hypothetical protein
VELGLRRGDVVAVRSEREIRATLDADGALDGLPFMPEMARFCGGTFTVAARADRICVEGAGAMRRVPRAVFLDDLRCDGDSHGGCGRSCLLLWKEAWLLRSTTATKTEVHSPPLTTRTEPDPPRSCQSTELLRSSEARAGSALRQRLAEVMAHEVTLVEFVRAALFALRSRAGRWRWSEPAMACAVGARPLETRPLDLRAGDLVEVRRLDEIRATLDDHGRQRGLEFCRGMEEHCGRRYRVAARVERIIQETTGAVRNLGATVTLQGVRCSGCARRNDLFWREAWLRRV